MSDLYIEARLQAIKDIASASCADIKDAENISSFCDEIYSAVPNLVKVIEELETNKQNALEVEESIKEYDVWSEAIEIVKHGGVADDVCEPSADKVKVTSLEVIVTGSKRKPYYEIKYKEVGADHYNIGYSSYNLDFVLDWKEKCFELIKVVE